MSLSYEKDEDGNLVETEELEKPEPTKRVIKKNEIDSALAGALDYLASSQDQVVRAQADVDLWKARADQFDAIAK